MRFVNCAFWGPALHNAIIGGQGFVFFSDCYFSSGKEDNYDSPLLEVESGRIQVNNSTFATPHVGVELGVQHAIIQGNNGCNGARVVNRIGEKAILAENEPESIP